jgi:hypothetical protein
VEPLSKGFYQSGFYTSDGVDDVFGYQGPGAAPVAGLSSGGVARPFTVSAGQAGNGIASALGVFRANQTDALAAAALEPPHTNRGVPDTNESKRVLLDYVSFTVPLAVCSSLSAILEWLTPPSASASDWVALRHGAMGYRACVQRGQIRVYSDGAHDMGFHAVLAGKGARQLEQEFGLFSEPAWVSWLALMRARGVRFARIDAAMDDVGSSGVLDMGVIKAAAKGRQLVSFFRKCRLRKDEEWSLSEKGGEGCSDEGETLYFGSRSSNMFVRIYNKGAQLGEAFHHIRVEMEAKERNAEEMVTRILKHGLNVIPQLLRSYLDFKTPKDTVNKSTWETAPWWAAFLDGCAKYKLRVGRVAVGTVDRVKAWLQRQTAQSFALVFDCIEKECKVSGLDPKRLQRRFFNTLLEDGRSRYGSKHRMMLDGFFPVVSLERGLL